MSFFSPNVDEIVSFLFGPFYFFTRIITAVKAGKLSQTSFAACESLDYFHQSVWRCYLSLASPLPAPSVGLFYGAQLSWEAGLTNKKYIQDHLHTVMTALNCILYSEKRKGFIWNAVSVEVKPVTPTEVIILIEAFFSVDLKQSWRGFCNLHLC